MRELSLWTTPQANTWEEVSLQVNHTVERLKELNPFLTRFSTLRKGTKVTIPGKAIGVSYSEEGLKWVCNNKCEALYFTNTKLSGGQFKGDLVKNERIIIEDFIPRDHYFSKESDGSRAYLNKTLQVAEYIVTDKAFRMLYVPSDNKAHEPNKVMVYNSRVADREKRELAMAA